MTLAVPMPSREVCCRPTSGTATRVALPAKTSGGRLGRHVEIPSQPSTTSLLCRWCETRGVLSQLGYITGRSVSGMIVQSRSSRTRLTARTQRMAGSSNVTVAAPVAVSLEPPR